MGRHKESIKIELPTGVTVGEKPENIELFTRGRGKWVVVVEKLRVLKATESLRYDLSSSDDIKKAKTAIVGGLKYTAEEMGEKRVLRAALMGSILHLWLK